jgi:zinc protease
MFRDFNDAGALACGAFAGQPETCVAPALWRLGLPSFAASGLPESGRSAGEPFTGAEDSLNIERQEHLLSNGLRVILYRDNRVPLAHVSVYYRVGSSCDPPGHSGLAHLFEHLMFEGSENVGKNEHGRLLDAAGGAWNASTNKDRTNYFATVPSNYLDLALWLEADRMRSLNLTPANFENQRQTVIEERRQSYDNRPYGRSHLRFDELAYSNWAYAHSIIGSVEDLQALTLEEAVDFHRRFYGPGNALLVVAGDIEEDAALKLVERRFGSIANLTVPFVPDLGEPPQDAPRQETHVDSLAALPALMLGFHMPELGAPDYYALSVLSLVLTHGESSRLHRRMIADNNWVTAVYAGPNQYKGPQLFAVWAQTQDGVPIGRVLAELTEALAVAAATRLTAEELEKARNNIAHAFIARLTRVSQIGETLATYAAYFDDADLINTELERFCSVSADDVRDSAARVFRPENQTTIIVEPGRKAR